MLIAEYDYDMDIEVLNKLNQILLKDGRYDDLKRASEDTTYQEELLRKYGLINN